MPNAVKLWQTALRQLQQLPTVRQEASSEGSLPTVQEFLTLPTCNHTVWKRLAKELQVPLHLGQAVASATDPFTPRAYAAISALRFLGRKAMSDGALLDAHSTVGTSAGSLPSYMGRQLQHSGLVAALPGLLDAAAVALADAQHDPDLAHVPQHSNYVLSTSGSLSLGLVPASGISSSLVAAAINRVFRTKSVAGGLLEVLSICMRNWPQLFDTAAVCVPALRLCAATMQFCSRCADLTSPAAPAPTALEGLLFWACSVVQAVCASWERQDQDGAAFASSAGHPAGLQAISMVLLALTLCPQRFDNSTASSTAPVPLGTPDSIRVSQAAWQFACTHQSDFSELLQQVLQTLGCGSGRALMFAAQHGISFINTSRSVELITGAYMQFAQHWPPVPQGQMRQADEAKQLAEALAQLQDGDSPPCGSRLLPCAALLWLMPAVLLEWAQKQPADWAGTSTYCQCFSIMYQASLEHVCQNQQFWARAHSMFALVAGLQGEAGSSKYGAATHSAAGFSKGFKLPAPHLVQLLHLTSSAGAYVMARMQDAVRVATAGGSSSAGDGSASGVTHSQRNSIANGSASSQCSDAQRVQSCRELGTALMQLSLASDDLQGCLGDRILECASGLAAPLSASSSTAGSSTSADSEQQASLTSLCAAWQQTVPQLASMTEAALRSEYPSMKGRLALSHGSLIAQKLCRLGLFATGVLQPSSPALKPLSGLVFTLLKASASVLAQPEPDEPTALTAAACLSLVMCLNSLVLQAACASASTSTSSDSSSAVINMLSRSKVSSCECNAAEVSVLSSITSLGVGSSSVEDDAVALMPWLVSLGRCCMGYATVLQQCQAGAAALGNAAFLMPMAQALQEAAAVLPAWLQSDSVSAQLAAAGYSTQRVIELLQSAAQAGQDASQAGAAAVPPELLQELGLALCNLPVGTACNNHRCSSLAGLSEQQLVVGTARLCAGCRVARYCCRACQVAAWKQHKPACKAVASARAAKSAEKPA